MRECAFFETSPEQISVSLIYYWSSSARECRFPYIFEMKSKCTPSCYWFHAFLGLCLLFPNSPKSGRRNAATPAIGGHKLGFANLFYRGLWAGFTAITSLYCLILIAVQCWYGIRNFLSCLGILLFLSSLWKKKGIVSLLFSSIIHIKIQKEFFWLLFIFFPTEVLQEIDWPMIRLLFYCKDQKSVLDHF